MAKLKPAPLIGLLVGAIVWALSTQVGYTLVTTNCELVAEVLPLIVTICLLVAIIGGLLSFTAWPAGGDQIPARAADRGHPRSFIAVVSVLAVALFALAIILQGVAGLIVDGCQR